MHKILKSFLFYVCLVAAILVSLSMQSEPGEESPKDSESESDPFKMTKEEYDTWCSDVTKNNMYTLGLKLHCTINNSAFNTALMLAVFLIIAIELVLHRLDLVFKNKVLVEVLNKVYRELMALGMISFGVQLAESAGLADVILNVLVTKQVSNVHTDTIRRVKIFELVHITLFVLSVFYVIGVAVSFLIIRNTWRNWANFETRNTELEVLQEYNEMKAHSERSNCCLRLCNIMHWYRLTTVIEKINYYSVRRKFLQLNRLNSDFRFDLYLKMRIHKLFIELIEISYRVWAIIFGIAFINSIRIRIYNVHEKDGGLFTFVMVFGVASLITSLFISIWLRLSYSFYVNNIDDSTTGEDNSHSLVQMQPVSEVDEKEEGNISLENQISLVAENSMDHYFLFRSPYMTFLLIQLILLVQSFYLAFLLVHYTHIIVVEKPVVQVPIIPWIILLGCMTPTLIMLFILLPLKIAPMTILSSVGSLSNMEAIRLARKLQKKGAKNEYSDASHHHEHESYFENSASLLQKLLWKNYKLKKQVQFLQMQQQTLPVNFEIYHTGPMVFASPSAQPTTQNGSAVPIFPTWLSILVKDSQIDEMVTLSIVLVFLIAFVLIDILRPIHFRIGQKVITQLQFSFRRIRATNWVIVGSIHSAQLVSRYCVYLITVYSSTLFQRTQDSSVTNWILFMGMILSALGYIFFGVLFDLKWGHARSIMTGSIVLHAATATGLSFLLLNRSSMTSWVVLFHFTGGYCLMCFLQTASAVVLHKLMAQWYYCAQEKAVVSSISCVFLSLDMFFALPFSAGLLQEFANHLESVFFVSALLLCIASVAVSGVHFVLRPRYDSVFYIAALDELEKSNNSPMYVAHVIEEATSVTQSAFAQESPFILDDENQSNHHTLKNEIAVPPPPPVPENRDNDSDTAVHNTLIHHDSVHGDTEQKCQQSDTLNNQEKQDESAYNDQQHLVDNMVIDKLLGNPFDINPVSWRSILISPDIYLYSLGFLVSSLAAEGIIPLAMFTISVVFNNDASAVLTAVVFVCTSGCLASIFNITVTGALSRVTPDLVPLWASLCLLIQAATLVGFFLINNRVSTGIFLVLLCVSRDCSIGIRRFVSISSSEFAKTGRVSAMVGASSYLGSAIGSSLLILRNQSNLAWVTALGVICAIGSVALVLLTVKRLVTVFWKSNTNNNSISDL